MHKSAVGGSVGVPLPKGGYVVSEQRGMSHLEGGYIADPSALGLYSEICVHPETKEIIKTGNAYNRWKVRRLRYERQATAGSLFSNERVGKCGRVPIKDSRRELWIHSDGEEGDCRAHFAGFQSCGSPWVCPICASKITEARRKEIAKAIDLWAERKTNVDGIDQEGSVFMVTFTFQHSKRDRLAELRSFLNEAYRQLKSGRWWQRFEARHHLAGSIAGHEVTYSRHAGWHPHKHTLFFSELPSSKLNRETIEKELSDRFLAIMGDLGRYASAVYGVKVGTITTCRRGEDTAADIYIAKWGLASEVSKNPVKKGKDETDGKHYSPFELLDIANDEPWAAQAFIEYGEAMHGVKQLVWSRGLRELLGIKAPEKTDDELAVEQVETGDVLLYSFSREEWKFIIFNNKRAEVLEVAELGDPTKFLDYMEDLKRRLPVFDTS